jgi:hypothetical protein
MSSIATNRFLRAFLGIAAFALLVLAGVHLGRMDLTLGARALVLLAGGSAALLVLGFSRDVPCWRRGPSRGKGAVGKSSNMKLDFI